MINFKIGKEFFSNKKNIYLIVFFLFLFLLLLFSTLFVIFGDLKEKENTFLFFYSISLSFIIGTILFFLYIYNKKNIDILNIKKIILMSMFLSIFIIQSFITRFLPIIDGTIPISLDEITVVVVAFFIGPLESILYAFVADTTRTIINGWSYQLLAATIFPIIACFSSYFSHIYETLKDKKINNTFYFIFFQLLIISFLTFSIIFLVLTLNPNNSININNKKLNYVLVIILSSIFFFLLESVFIYFFFKEKHMINLVFFISLSIIVSRIITGYIIRPFEIYYFYDFPWKAGIVFRIITSSYYVPINIFFSIFLYRSCIWADENY